MSWEQILKHSVDPDEMAHMSHLIRIFTMFAIKFMILTTANLIIVWLRKRELVALPNMGKQINIV